MFDTSGDWLFDDCGDCVHAGSMKLRQMLPMRVYCGDFFAALVKNLGFVGVRPRRTHFELCLRAEVVSPVALSSVMYWLEKRQPRNLVICEFENSKIQTICASAPAAIAHITQLTARRGIQARFNETEIPIETLHGSHSPLAALLDIWRDDGRTRINRLITFANEKLARRFSVTDAPDGEPRFLLTGEGMWVPDLTWHRQAIGTPVANQPDSNYWTWVAGRQARTLLMQQPYVADIDATIYWPTFGEVRRVYRRLLLPCVLPDGSAALFSASHSGIGFGGTANAA